jgi:hypothetical protein
MASPLDDVGQDANADATSNVQESRKSPLEVRRVLALYDPYLTPLAHYSSSKLASKRLFVENDSLSQEWRRLPR